MLPERDTGSANHNGIGLRPAAKAAWIRCSLVLALSALSGSVRELRQRRRLPGLLGLLALALPFLE
jgi:hypothetical protein